MATRFRDEATYLDQFGATLLVRCPRCGGRAEFAAPSDATGRQAALRRVVCAGCGYVRNGRADGPNWDALSRGNVDPYSGLPLWLQTPCCGETLWAYNMEHLAFLERYVAATLRERTPNKNSSLASRLPAWLTSAKNREEVLRGIARLRALGCCGA